MFLPFFYQLHFLLPFHYGFHVGLHPQVSSGNHPLMFIRSYLWCRWTSLVSLVLLNKITYSDLISQPFRSDHSLGVQSSYSRRGLKPLAGRCFAEEPSRLFQSGQQPDQGDKGRCVAPVRQKPGGINAASVGPICSLALWAWLKLTVWMKDGGGRAPNPPHDSCALKTRDSNKRAEAVLADIGLVLIRTSFRT